MSALEMCEELECYDGQARYGLCVFWQPATRFDLYVLKSNRIRQGRSDEGYIGIYTLPKSVPENYFVH